MSEHSKRSREGYLRIENRHGPLMVDLMTGLTVPRVLESATITCAHCHAIVVLNPNRTRPRNYCSKCDDYVCEKAACVVECRSLNQLFDKLQESAAKEG